MKQVCRWSLLLIFVCMGWNSTAMGKVPPLTAEAYCLIDRTSGQFMLGEQENEKRPMASTTKILTALLAAEYADPEAEATVSEQADHTAEYTAGLQQGQTISIQDALKGALVKSYNDAAVVLAEYVAGDEAFFAQLMTKKAFALGAVHTNFQNASGLPAENHYSTAYDLALLSRAALQNPTVAEIVGSPEVSFSHPGYLEALTLCNTNPLLTSYEGADGVKTGTTNAAGKCLIASATRGDRALIAVALHAADRAGDCRRLLDYGFRAEERTVLTPEEELGTAPVRMESGRIRKLRTVAADSLEIRGGEGDISVERRIQPCSHLLPPVLAGESAGQVQVWLNGHYFAGEELRAGEEIVEEKWFDRALGWLMQRIYYWLVKQW